MGIDPAARDGVNTDALARWWWRFLETFAGAVVAVSYAASS